MAKFTLEINLGNAAMESPEHVGAALVKLGHKLSGCEGWCVDHAVQKQSDERWTQIRDENGNVVGKFAFVEDEEALPESERVALDAENASRARRGLPPMERT